MGSMKRKKRKKREKEWAAFQQEHGLTDETLQLAREMGYPTKVLREKLAGPTFPDSLPVADRIGDIREKHVVP